MKSIEIFQVDAFTDHLFGGNPAAVCILKEWPENVLLQSVAAENNLAETAFIIQRNNHFEIRWFTPTIEVELCGHATLAAAFVIFNQMHYHKDEIIFKTVEDLMLRVSKEEDLLMLNFPVDAYTSCEAMPEIIQGIGRVPLETYKSRLFYLALLKDEEEVLKISPDLSAIASLDRTGLIASAPGKDVDFVSRSFAPQSGIDEDPVTGSAHTLLVPYWSRRLNRKNLVAKQISKRGGTLYCTDHGSRILIRGKARLYLKGEIFIIQ